MSNILMCDCLKKIIMKEESLWRKTNLIKSSEVTVSLIRDSKPVKLFKWLKDSGYEVDNPYGGVYYVKGNIPFDTQIVVTRELDGAEHLWLRSLTDNISEEVAKTALAKAGNEADVYSKELMGDVLYVSVKANSYRYRDFPKEDKEMDGWAEVYAEPLAKYKAECEAKGKAEGIAEGIAEGRNTLIMHAIKNGAKPEDFAILGIDEAEVKEVMKRNKAKAKIKSKNPSK